MLAYLSWGLVPIFWKQIQNINSFTILAQRTFWATLFFLGLCIVFENRNELLKYLRNYRLLKIRILCTLVLSVNWGLYIWAVNSGQIIASSLGYFLNPILNILIGVVLLKESFQTYKKIAFGLALLGAIILTVGLNVIPWISLSLAVSFSLYGYFRKGIQEPVWVSSLFESFLMILFVGISLSFLGIELIPKNASQGDWLFLVLSGIVTGLPLLFFARAAQRLPLSTMGYYQYISPTLQFLTGVLIYREALSIYHQIAFLLVWSALGVISWGAIRNWKVQK